MCGVVISLAGMMTQAMFVSSHASAMQASNWPPATCLSIIVGSSLGMPWFVPGLPNATFYISVMQFGGSMHWQLSMAA